PILPSPGDRASAHLAPANPIEGLAIGGRVGIVYVVNEELPAVLVTRVALRLNLLALAKQRSIADRPAILHLVRPCVFVEVFVGIKLASGLEHDDSHAFFAKFLRGPPTGRA